MPPFGRVRAIASTIRSICFCWKSSETLFSPNIEELLSDDSWRSSTSERLTWSEKVCFWVTHGCCKRWFASVGLNPNSFCSDSLKRYCISMQMKSIAWGEIRLKILRMTSNVARSVLSFVWTSAFWRAWKRQHSLFIFLSCATYSSLTMSIPSVAQIVKRTPRSKRSIFFSSLIDC